MMQGKLLNFSKPQFSYLQSGNNNNIYLKGLLLGLHWLKYVIRDFPGGAVVKNPPANTGDTGSSPGLGRSHIPQSN